MNTSSGIPGAQTLRRGLSILGLLAEHHLDGLRIADVAERTGLERATTHRLLTSLVEEQFAERDASSKRYRLGMEAMRLGLASLQRAPHVDAFRPVMQRISRITGDTTFLLVRQGDYAVCLHREEGPYPVRVFTTEVGAVRPLGIGAAGIALLAALPDEAIDVHLKRHAVAFKRAELDPPKVLRSVARTRRQGFSETTGEITQGVCGVGAVIPTGNGGFAAVSVGAIESRLGQSRRAEVGRMLVERLAEGAAQVSVS
jgi:DNA-binding IclR family transcriptional regulator